MATGPRFLTPVTPLSSALRLGMAGAGAGGSNPVRVNSVRFIFLSFIFNMYIDIQVL